MRRRWYRVVVKGRNGRRVSVAHGPLTHDEAVTVLKKLGRHAWRQEMVEEIRGGYRVAHAKRLRRSTKLRSSR